MEAEKNEFAGVAANPMIRTIKLPTWIRVSQLVRDIRTALAPYDPDKDFGPKPELPSEVRETLSKLLLKLAAFRDRRPGEPHLDMVACFDPSQLESWLDAVEALEELDDYPDATKTWAYALSGDLEENPQALREFARRTSLGMECVESAHVEGSAPTKGSLEELIENLGADARLFSDMDENWIVNMLSQSGKDLESIRNGLQDLIEHREVIDA